MALHFELKVNDKAIAYFEAVRVEGDCDDFSPNKYRVYVVRADGQAHYSRPGLEFMVEHYYSDGAFVLIRKALAHYETSGGK